MHRLQGLLCFHAVNTALVVMYTVARARKRVSSPSIASQAEKEAARVAKEAAKLEKVVSVAKKIAGSCMEGMAGPYASFKSALAAGSGSDKFFAQQCEILDAQVKEMMATSLAVMSSEKTEIGFTLVDVRSVQLDLINKTRMLSSARCIRGTLRLDMSIHAR